MEIDEVFNNYAEFGFYQKQIYFHLAAIQTYLAFHQVHNVFLGAEPKWYCELPSGGRAMKKCPTDEITCKSIQFTNEDFTSIVSEFDLVCENAGKASMIQSYYMAGILFGSLLFGKLADKFGRKPVVCSCAIGMAVSSLLGLVLMSYWWYVLARFLTAVFCGGLGLVSFVMLSELLGQRKRGLAGMTIPGAFALGIALFAYLAYVLPAWQSLTICTSVPGFIGIYWIWEFPESPRWYYSQGRVDDAEKALSYIIQRNSGNPPEKPVQLVAPKTSGSRAPAEGFSNLLTHRVLRSCTLINVFTWFTNCCVYYGLTMGAGNLGGNMYMSVALSGLVEIPTYLATAWVIETRLGRKISFSVSQIIGAILCGLLFIMPASYTSTRIALALGGKIAISMSFSIDWLFSAEMYPTSIRNQGVSVCTGAARVGGVITPMLMRLSATTYVGIDYAIFGVLCLMSGILALKLPETLGKALPETVADLDKKSTRETRGMGEMISEDKVKLLQEEIEANSNHSGEE